MFNLLISYDPDSWNGGEYEYAKTRVAVEYTADEISERYRALDQAALDELMSLPTLFAVEQEAGPTRIGRITDIRIRAQTVVISYQFDNSLPALPPGTLESLRTDIDLGNWELSRTHWAIKDEPIFEILRARGLIDQNQLENSSFRSPDLMPEAIAGNRQGEFNTRQVFIVHGHDEIAKLEMAKFISDIGLEPIILHMQASGGRTIIEKIEHYSNVGFGIVLYTPCDVGQKVGSLQGAYRARQNVVFEHGFLVGKLGRSRVSAIVKGQLETPNDISGVVYIQMDPENQWRGQLTTELRANGYAV